MTRIFCCLPSFSIKRYPARPGLPLLSSSWTFETCKGAGNLMVCPVLAPRAEPCARKWREAIFTPSTTRRPSAGNTWSTLPSLPLSLPAITRTLSPVLIFILKDFRGKRNDLAKSGGAQFARHRAENARAFGFLRILIHDHARVFVKTDIGSVRAARFLAGAHHHDRYDIALFNAPVRRGFFYDRGHEVAKHAIVFLVASEHANHLQEFGSGIIRDLDHAAMLHHIRRFQSSQRPSSACRGKWGLLRRIRPHRRFCTRLFHR